MTSNNIGEIIKNARREHKITQKELCAGICSETQLSSTTNTNKQEYMNYIKQAKSGKFFEMNYNLLSKYRSELMGIAMLWVIFFHAWSLNFTFGVLNHIRSIGFGGVDIFIMLSAMGLVCSLSKSTVSYGIFLKKRLVRILPAYYLVMIPFSLWQYWVGDIQFSTLFWNSTILNYWVCAENGFNWYITAILMFYAITPFWFFIMKKISSYRKQMLLVLIWTTAGVAVCQMLMHDDYWCYLDVFYRFPIYFMGLWIGFAVYEQRKISIRGGVLWLALGALGVVFLVFRKYSSFYLATCYTFIMTTVPMCLVLSWIMEKLPDNPLFYVLRKIGVSSLEIYLLNVTFFSEIERFSALLSVSYETYCWLSIPLNVIMGILLHYALTRILNRKKQTG